MLFQHRATVFGVLLLSLASHGHADDLADLRTQLESSEDKLLNIKIESTYRSDRWDQKSQSWEPNSSAELTAWYTGLPGSKARVNFQKNLLPWTNGITPFSQEKQQFAYNGLIEQYLLLETGDPAHPVTTLRGNVYGQRSKAYGAYAGDASGWTVSLYGREDAQGRRVSQIFDDPTELHLAKVQFAGFACVELAQPATGKTFYFDPAFGYALRGFRLVGGSNVRIAEVTVQELIEPTPGVFYPTKVATNAYSPDTGQPVTRSEYVATSVLANDPDFSDDIFTIEWPSGTAVADKTSGKVVIVGGKDDAQAKRLKGQVDRLATMRTTAPAEVATTLGASPPGGATVYWVLGVLAAFIVIVAVVITFKRRPRAVPVWFAMLALLCPAIAHADSGTFLDQSGDQSADNCGLNTIMLLRGLYGLDDDWARTKADLKIGDHGENAVSMLALKSEIEAFAPDVAAYKRWT